MKSKLNIAVFLTLLFVLLVLIVIVPPDERSVIDENRNLTKMPSLNSETIFNGRFSAQFDSFVADSVGFRSYLISASNLINKWQGLTLSDDAKIVIRDVVTDAPDVINLLPIPTVTPSITDMPVTETATEAPQPEVSNTPTPETQTDEPTSEPTETATVSPEPTKTADTDLSPIKAGPVLKFKDKIVEIYGFNKTSVLNYVNIVNSYRESLGRNVRIFSAPMPTHIEFLDEKYRSASDSQRKAMDFIKDRLSPDVHFVDAYDLLKEHSDEYLFFRTDHHWTATGAYYGYVAFAEEAGFEPLSLTEDYNEDRLENFLGYLYSVTPDEYLKQHPDYITYYTLKEPIETSNKLLFVPKDKSYATYSIFMGGDWDYYKVTTSVKNGKTVIILKDSYANAFIPFLAPHYENIVVIDPRKYTGSVFNEVAKYQDVDLVFFDYIFVPGRNDFVQDLINIR